jgi:CBS domain-containing protein
MRAQILGPATPIRSLVSRPVEFVSASCTLGQAAIAMREANVSSVLVAGEGRSGIVTERDLTRALAAGLGPEEPISLVTSVHPVRLSAETPIVDVAALMLNEEVRHVVVGEDGFEAVVSLRDVMAVLLQAVSPRMWLDSLRIAVVGHG